MEKRPTSASGRLAFAQEASRQQSMMICGGAGHVFACRFCGGEKFGALFGLNSSNLVQSGGCLGALAAGRDGLNGAWCWAARAGGGFGFELMNRVVGTLEVKSKPNFCQFAGRNAVA
jgi:hypothetical protein